MGERGYHYGLGETFSGRTKLMQHRDILDGLVKSHILSFRGAKRREIFNYFKISPFGRNDIMCIFRLFTSSSNLVIGPFGNAKQAENAVSYMQTKFFHLSLIHISEPTRRT